MAEASLSPFSRRLRAAVFVPLLVLGAACSISSSPDDGIDYKSAGVREPLDVPPDLVNPARSSRDDLTRSAADTNLSDYRRARAATGADASANSRVLPSVTGAQIMHEGRERWLRVQAPAEQVWPVVRDFWLDNGFLIATESPETGVIETDWAENRAKIPSDFLRNTLGKVLDSLYSTGERDRFLTRLDRRDGATDIVIAHRGMEEVYTDQRNEQTRWQPRPTDPGLELEFLRRLMLRFGADEQSSRAAAENARQPELAPMAKLIGQGSGAQLQVNEGFDRAWRRVGLALDRGGFTVEDRNRTEGLYFVRYIDPTLKDRRPGFFSRVFGGAPDLDPAERYRILVADAGEQSKVSVQLADGKPVPDSLAETAERMLRVLQEQLEN
ncbi:MAG: outer membrane protein assembly factor BamC [Burkholderiaceae bacterium]